MEKIRSKNNRTLAITEEEKATLKNTIYNINDLKHSYKDNSIINGDKSIQGYDGVFWERNSIKK